MRILPIFAAVFAILLGSAPARAETDLARWAQYAPKGWRIISAVEGKLGTPQSAHAVLIAEQDKPELHVKNDSLGPDTLNLNPRHLLVLGKTTGDYGRIGHAAEFLPSAGDTDAPCLADPLEEGGIDISKGILSIRLHYWLSCGSYGVTKRTFKFRKEAKGFRLIGAEVFSFSRSGGTAEETSVNFLTGRKKMTTGIAMFEDDDVAGPAKPKVTWGKAARTAFYLDTMNRSDCERDDKPGWCLD
jgi:hypothetical protein